ncbi:ankyrin repeat domain-containing protein [Bacillus sp. Xin]|uniref:ankyrin repeat domain-containing protein n=1 Tax=unclassified Bacillus (in: firmicutes) TaxID=185979 RepID=UPI001572F4EA|nr:MULTISPECIES: ankyrin repeat domain-containing protein [unclassified Bacillus (in: firmicutes)]MBC6975395.1 ankyrin repeat domain-containing protein [Bacillus sp. Xin]NSW37465.1 ankyrin repeat domain-containing protein [Bacillus sp. Xin1]
MLKRTLNMICCLFFFQGCTQNQEPKKEIKNMEKQLLTAVEQRETATVLSLVQQGVNTNVTDSKGRTPVMIATYGNDVKTAKILIDAGADVNIRDGMKNNPFLYAGAEGYLEILKLTIDAGADPTLTNRYGGTALIPAAEHGYIEVIKELLTRTNIDVNHVNNLGWTALMEAIVLSDSSKEQQQVIRLLIEHGADVNISDHDGVTPLQHARTHKFKEIEEILLQAGAQESNVYK